MKRLSILLLIAILAGCSSPNDETRKAKIIEYKDKIADYNQKIKELESQMTDTTKSESNKIPVTIETIQPVHFNHYFEVNGKVEAVNDAFISPEMNGQVKTIHVTEGERVKKGDLLITLNTAVTESSIKELKNGLELATKVYNKQKSLYDQGIGSEIQYLEAKNNKESLELKIKTLKAQKAMSQIKAPFSGIVDDIFVKKGEIASPGMRVIQLVDLKKIRIEADVSEAYLADIREGDSVHVSFPAFPEMDGNYPIDRIGNVVNVENRSFKIVISLPNVEEKLKPNLLAVLKINDYSFENAMVVPSIIIKQDMEGYFFYLANGELGHMTARKIYVEPGRSYKAMTMIKKGLDFGDQVIVEGYNMLTDGSAIKQNLD